MSSFVWMKVLESAPERYDRGIQMLSRGRMSGVYLRIAELAAAPGKRVLDIGCGTGGVTLACAGRGADVFGLDVDSGMLAVARGKPVPEGSGSVRWLEAGVGEIVDHFGEGSLDAVVSCLAFSELSVTEQEYTLRTAHRCLVPGGRLVVADETLPAGGWQRAWARARRMGLVAATYLMTQTTTRPVVDLAARIRAAGFVDIGEERLWSDTFVIVHAIRGATT
jgi:ubiquinone/menaquinone biosynthesis C-methylase UbiE